MLVTLDAIRSHLRFAQDIAEVRHLNLLQRHYRARRGIEREALTVALADNLTDQADLRAAAAIANGRRPDQLDRNGFTVGRGWVDITPSIAQQVRAYATDARRVGYRAHVA